MSKRYLVTGTIAFVAALIGVLIGRLLFAEPMAEHGDVHAVLHEELSLDPAQKSRLEVLEKQFAARRRQLETQLRLDNRGLAAAMESEHRDGPAVNAAIDASHVTMGRLQKETVAHVFAMRAILRQDQASVFDGAITKALVEEHK